MGPDALAHAHIIESNYWCISIKEIHRGFYQLILWNVFGELHGPVGIGLCGASVVCGLLLKPSDCVGDCPGRSSCRLWCANLASGSVRCHRHHLPDHATACSTGDIRFAGIHEEDAVPAKNF